MGKALGYARKGAKSRPERRIYYIVDKKTPFLMQNKIIPIEIVGIKWYSR